MGFGGKAFGGGMYADTDIQPIPAPLTWTGGYSIAAGAAAGSAVPASAAAGGATAAGAAAGSATLAGT